MEDNFVNSLEDLTGRVALVTGGAAGIGLETTIYLAQKGATVYVASRNQEKSEKGIAEAKKRLRGKGGDIKFHSLDLASIAVAKASALAFKEKEQRLDILVCNAGISMMTLKELSPDGYERMFATNHLGHFAFVTTLLDLIERTATSHEEARIVIVSSTATKFASTLDYKALMTKKEGEGSKVMDLTKVFKRYGDSKLANQYFTIELDRQIRARGITNIYCNTGHPGTDATTGLGASDQTAIGPFVEGIIRATIKPFSNSTIDAAKTQTYLAASKDIREKDVHGQYWEPIFGWTGSYRSCHKVEYRALALDEAEQKKLWNFSEEALQKATASS